MTADKNARYLLLTLGLLLLAYLWAYHIREATKFLTWMHSGFRESQLVRISEQPPVIAFQSVVPGDFDHEPFPVAGDTVLAVNNAAAENLADVPCAANTPLPVTFVHDGDTLSNAFAMRAPSIWIIVGMGLCGGLRCLVSLLSLSVGLWALHSRNPTTVARLFALYSFSVAAMVSSLYYFLSSSYAGFSIPLGVFFTTVWSLFGFFYVGLWLHLQYIYPRTLVIVRDRPMAAYLLCYVPCGLLILLWINSALGGLLIGALADPNRAQLAQVTIATIPALGSLAILTYRYRSSTQRLELRQLRLILWAAALGIVINDLTGLIGHIAPIWYSARLYRSLILVAITFIAMSLGPLSFGYAFRRYRLMEVEGKLRRGTRYALLTGTLIALLIGIMYGFTEFVRAHWGVAARAPGVVLTFVLALTIIPAQRRVNRLLEEHFYPERARLRKILDGFLEQASALTDLQLFWSELLVRLQEGLQAEVVQLELVGAVGTRFGPESLLMRHLAQTRRALPLDELTDSGRLSADQNESSWLGDHHTALLLPFVRNNSLIAFISIGPRTDEEDYDAEVLEILNTLAPQVAVAAENIRLTEENADKKRMEHELQLARKTQKGFLPQKLPPTPGLEVAGNCQFCLEVAGDYYDVIPLEDGRTVLAVGDVSGKGAAAALLMASLQAALHTSVDMGRPLSTVVAGINNLIHRNTPPEQYITFFVAVFDPADHKMVYVNAGHNAPIIRRVDGECSLLEDGGPILGCLPGFPYSSGTTLFERGDTLVCYTDGASEAMNADGEEFGDERIQALLQDGREYDANALIECIEAQIVAHHGVAQFEDDFTLLVARAI